MNKQKYISTQISTPIIISLIAVWQWEWANMCTYTSGQMQGFSGSLQLRIRSIYLPCPQPGFLSKSRFTSSSVTRPAVTVINLWLFRRPHTEPGQLPALSADRSVCTPPLLYLSLSLSLSLSASLDKWPHLCHLSATTIDFHSSPSLLLLSLPHPNILHTQFCYWFKNRVTRAWCFFWSVLFFFKLRKKGCFNTLFTSPYLAGWFKWLTKIVILAVKMLNL